MLQSKLWAKLNARTVLAEYVDLHEIHPSKHWNSDEDKELKNRNSSKVIQKPLFSLLNRIFVK